MMILVFKMMILNSALKNDESAAGIYRRWRSNGLWRRVYGPGKMMNFGFKMMSFVFKMMSFVYLK